ncbi:hypothetical protein L6Q96_20015 [Candidatus Binatia bacterium]|nr:hypothetical protein [Candidatus Binatia bacterium]
MAATKPCVVREEACTAEGWDDPAVGCVFPVDSFVDVRYEFSEATPN